MIGKILGAVVGNAIDRGDGKGGLKGALIGAVAAGGLRRIVPFGLAIGGLYALKKVVDDRRVRSTTLS